MYPSSRRICRGPLVHVDNAVVCVYVFDTAPSRTITRRRSQQNKYIQASDNKTSVYSLYAAIPD